MGDFESMTGLNNGDHREIAESTDWAYNTKYREVRP